METTFDLETKPLAKALISYAVRSISANAVLPETHLEWLQVGVTLTAHAITDKALLLRGRSSIASSDELPEDTPVIIGFSLFLMLGLAQAVSKEGISLDIEELTERLIEQHLHHMIRTTDKDQAAKEKILQISRVATQIPGQIVKTAQGEVEDLFSMCYAVLPRFLLGSDEDRGQMMSVYGTALHVLLESQIQPN